MERLEWKNIGHNTYRLEIPEGFIIRWNVDLVNSDEEPVSITSCMCFVPRKSTS